MYINLDMVYHVVEWWPEKSHNIWKETKFPGSFLRLSPQGSIISQKIALKFKPSAYGCSHARSCSRPSRHIYTAHTNIPFKATGMLHSHSEPKIFANQTQNIFFFFLIRQGFSHQSEYLILISNQISLYNQHVVVWKKNDVLKLARSCLAPI